MNLFVICLQDNRQLREMEGLGDSHGSQSSAETFCHLQSELVPQLILLSSCPSEVRHNSALTKVIILVSGALDSASGVGAAVLPRAHSTG